MPRLLLLPGLAALLAFAQAPSGPIIPLNVKTGSWQNQTTVSLSGSLGIPPDVAAKLTPEQRARYEAAMSAMGSEAPHQYTSKGCLTQQDLTTDPYKSLNRNNDKIQCTGAIVNSTSSDLELHETCTGEGEMDFHIKIHAVDSEHATGVGDGTVTVGGRTMKSHYTMDMNWLGPTCPPDSH